MPSSVKDIFMDALDLPAADRAAWLNRVCPDETTRRRVLELLAAHEVAPTFAPPQPAGSSIGTPGEMAAAMEAEGDRVGDGGRYELLRLLGEGGFGVVWLARQHEPISRDVAIKLLKFAADGSQIAARFEAERQTLARMDHPQIARVFDAGVTDRGRPFFVMEHVDGVPITTFARQAHLPLAGRLELFAQVCLGVQHAHLKGVIHRDLKPGNILVSRVDGTPMAKVIDFGIAKAIDPLDEQAAPQMTLEAQIIGTPQYMAPEQATIGPKNLDTRADIYSLGTVLYELLTGKPPFDPEELRRVGLDQVCRIVRERTPSKPSTRFDAPDPAEPLEAKIERARLRRLVAGEVDWIVMRALEKEPDRRYQTAAEFADDLYRFLRHEPIHARPPSRLYAARKFVRRHRIETALAALTVASLLGVAVLATVKERQARDARDLAQRNESIATANAIEAKRNADEARQNAERAERNAEEARRNADRAAAELSRADAIATFARRMLGGIGPAVSRGRDTTLLKDLLGVASQNLDATADRRQPTIDLLVRTMVAQAQLDLGNPDEATRTLRDAFDATRDGPARDSIERLRAGTLLAATLNEQGSANEALAAATEAVDGFTDRAELKSPDGLTARLAQAAALRRLRRYEEALFIQRGILAERVAADDGDGDAALRARGAIALLQNDLRRPLDALAEWEKVLDIQQRRYGVDHPATLATMSNLGVVYERVGRLDEAERFCRLVLEQERRIYEPGHPALARSLNNLAAVQLERDDPAGAQRSLDEANAIAAAKPEATRRYLKAIMAQGAQLCRRQGRFDDAVRIATALRDAYAEEFGPRGARTIPAITLLAMCRADAGDAAGAWSLLEAIDLDALPDELADDQRSMLLATAARVALRLGRGEAASTYRARARELAHAVEDGGAQPLRELAKLDATWPTSQPTAAR